MHVKCLAQTHQKESTRADKFRTDTEERNLTILEIDLVRVKRLSDILNQMQQLLMKIVPTGLAGSARFQAITEIYIRGNELFCSISCAILSFGSTFAFKFTQ